MEKPTVIIGSDHGGYDLKEKIQLWLKDWGYQVEDLGANTLDSEDDYPQYAFAVANAVVTRQNTLGILLCRSGGGMVIAANKIKKVRAVLVMDKKSAVHAREHNNANVISISADWVSEEETKEAIRAYLETPFTRAERHERRLAQIYLKEN